MKMVELQNSYMKLSVVFNDELNWNKVKYTLKSVQFSPCLS